jgi:tRNA1(Val) A37 N6-methylase TrmN6
MKSNHIDLDASLGQVWTPANIAEEMMRKIGEFTDKKSKILDPAGGPGTFLLAAQKSSMKFGSFDVFEVDPRLTKYIQENFNLPNIKIFLEDFLTYEHMEPNYDVAVLNPPYIRHELVDEEQKRIVSEIVLRRTSRQFTKRTNYFGYFLVMTASVLKPGGVMCAIVYDSLKATRYGQEILDYLLSSGNFISRQVISAPFENRMIDAEVLLWKKNISQEVAPLELLFEENVSNPEGYCLLSDLATVKRGTSFLKREYFVNISTSSDTNFIEMVTKQPMASGLIVKSNTYGLFKSDKPAEDVKALEQLKKLYDDPKLQNLSILPTPVYGDILFNYYMRENIRHLLNEDNFPASDNFYCVTPKNRSMRVVHWVLANSDQTIKRLLTASRMQGSGLRKLQLFEYVNSFFPDYRKFESEDIRAINEIGSSAIAENWPLEQLRENATNELHRLGIHDE